VIRSASCDIDNAPSVVGGGMDGRGELRVFSSYNFSIGYARYSRVCRGRYQGLPYQTMHRQV
jgi:hypothetical protein